MVFILYTVKEIKRKKKCLAAQGAKRLPLMEIMVKERFFFLNGQWLAEATAKQKL